jgi:hypothetical protein
MTQCIPDKTGNNVIYTITADTYIPLKSSNILHHTLQKTTCNQKYPEATAIERKPALQ